MTISELIELLESEMEREGDMEIFIYDTIGGKVEPKSIGIGCINRSGITTDYAYISNLE